MEKTNFSAYTIDGLLAILANARTIMQEHYWNYANEPTSRTYKLFAIQRDFVEEVKAELVERGARITALITYTCVN